MRDTDKPVVFLDRDGTLNVEIGYIRKIDDLVLIPGAADSIRRLNESGVKAILITNQSGAARKYFPESHIQQLHIRLQKLLADSNAFLDGIYYCPHLPEGLDPLLSMVCNCRKPATGLIERAYAEHSNLSKKDAFMVGDKEADVGLAINANMRSILVSTGYGNTTLQSLEEQNIQPDLVVNDITQAVDWILASLAKG